MVLHFAIFFSKALDVLPASWLGFLGDSIGWLWYHVLRFRRDVVRENLALAFGNEKTPAELDRIAELNFRHYGRVLVEVFQSLGWTPEQYRKRLVVEGLENIEAARAKGGGGFFLTSHLGNWEFAISSAASRGVPLDVVVKRSRTPSVESFLQWYRRKTGANVFLESGTARDILRSQSKGRFVGFILDQFMGPPIGLPVTFFGQKAGTAVALALLTDKRPIPILPCYSYRDERGTIHTVFEPELVFPRLSDDKEQRLFEKTQVFNDVLERHVRSHPEQWLWLHRRWKEYRGEPRWSPKASVTSATTALTAALLFLSSCSSAPTATPTGIALPADPSFSAPKFQAEAAEDATELTALAHPANEPIPTQVEAKAEAKNAPEGSSKKKMTKSTASLPPITTVKAKGKEGFKVIDSYRVPFELGERMEIDLNWMALPAGRAVLEVRDGVPFDNRPTYQLWGNVTSSKLVDAIYHIDNTIESFIDKTGLIPYKFLLHMVETHQLKETRVSFDHANQKAFYWAKRISQKWGDENPDRADSFVARSQDMFSALYFARALNYKLNEKQSFAVYENNQNLNVELLPVANELINTKIGAFQCWKVMVTIKLNNVLKPTGDMFVWFSDDSKKYVVKFDAKLKIGSLYGNLVGLKERK